MEAVERSGLQLRLFEGDVARFDRSFGTAVRTQLDPSSWVDYVPNWLKRNEVLFDDLMTMPDWEQRDRWMYTRRVQEPRLTAEYPILAETPIAMLRDIAGALSTQYRVDYDGLWINLYRDHRDSTSWHGDYSSCKRPICIVPVLSLGATRRFQLKPRDGGKSTTITVNGGDLVVMGGRCQEDWLHSVPKQATPAGPRISVNFKSALQATPE